MKGKRGKSDDAKSGSKIDEEGFHNCRSVLHLENMHTVNWAVVLKKADLIGLHVTPLSFDGLLQFLEQ